MAKKGKFMKNFSIGMNLFQLKIIKKGIR